MAETLTVDTTPQTETVVDGSGSLEGLTPDEQDSLQVGESMIEEQENLLAGKYKDAQELEKAYVELQKKLGDKGSGDSSEAGDSQDSEQVESKESEQETKEAKENTASNGILDQLWEQAHTKESYQKETVEALNKLSPVEIADAHLKFREQVERSQPQMTEKHVTELKNIAGGEQQYGEMLQWATNNLSDQEVKMFDAVMDQGNTLAAYFAVQSMALRYQDGVGRDGQMVTGKAPRSDGDSFKSQAEMVQAMEDPRYHDDTAYRDAIMQKLERSNINF